mmetsp:Transcript_223/g.546  ORF Transcript_223/g.546 Transcript_223/m.546 type:complete len:213 (+) Transcript_223:3328-3966(+)
MGENNSEATYGDDEEDSETANTSEDDPETSDGDDEPDFETENTGEEDFEIINEDDEKDSETETTGEEDSEIVIGGEGGLGIPNQDELPDESVDTGIFDDFSDGDIPIDEDVGNDTGSGSTVNNIFDAIVPGNESSYIDRVDDVVDEIVVASLNCFNRTECTDEILGRDASGYSCGDRIQYLMDVLNKSILDSCRQIAVDEYPNQCGLCGPSP